MANHSMSHITVLAETLNAARLMTAAIVDTTISRIRLPRGNHFVYVSIRERGKELLLGDEERNARLASVGNADRYALLHAMQEPDTIPSKLELSLTTISAENDAAGGTEDKTYCGRIHFDCLSAAAPESVTDTDTVLVILPERPSEELLTQLSQLLQSDIGVCVALECSAPPAEGSDPEQEFRKRALAAAGQLSGKTCSFQWYNAYGFDSVGEQNTEERAAPLGVLELFWDMLRISSQLRIHALSQELQQCQHTISSRNCTFQRSSMRRRLELNANRSLYSEIVKALYEAEHLLAAESANDLSDKE